MKINGVEVDMQKIVRMVEREFNKKEIRHEKISQGLINYWESEEGFQRKEQIRNIPVERKINRPRIQYKLTDIETGEEFLINGQVELAPFLGFKTINAKIRAQMMKKEVSNKSKNNIYKIEEII